MLIDLCNKSQLKFLYYVRVKASLFTNSFFSPRSTLLVDTFLEFVFERENIVPYVKCIMAL